jgi:hypothetical protein
MLVLPGTLITFSYQDKAPEGNDTLVLEVLNSALGVLSASPWPALPGQPLSLTLVDRDIYESTSSSASIIMSKTLRLSGPSMDPHLVRNEVAGEVEMVDDGTANGRFTGVVLPLLPDQVLDLRQQWQPGSAINSNDGVISVNYDDWLLLEYEDLLPLKTVKYKIKVAMPAVIESSQLRVGGEMTITVFDSDLNWLHDQIDTFHTTASVAPGSSVRLPLLETDVNSGKFTGLLSTDSSSATDPFISNSTYLAGVSLGQTVDVVYEEHEPRKTLKASQTVVSSRIGLLSTNAVRGNINKRDLLSITVVDLDLNMSPILVDTAEVIITLYAPASGSRNQLPETLTLYETSLNGSLGVFTGTLQTHYGSRNSAKNGVMDVFDGDHLVVRYRDAAPANTLERTVKVSTAGTVTLIPLLLDAGKSITVQVNDYDLNINPIVADVGSAVVRSASGDVQHVSLLETALDSSIFTGAMPTSANYSAPAGTLAGVIPDSVITATYMDDIVDTTTRSQSYSTLARVATNGSLSLLPVLITQDLPVTITVTDKDQNENSSGIETVGCQLISLCSEETKSWDGSPLCSINPGNEAHLDVQNITLTETSQSSGIFTSIVATHSENRSNASKIYHEPSVRAPSGAIVRLVYLDKNPKPSRLRQTERRVARAGLLYASTSFINEYGPLIITLEDADLDASNLRDTNCAAGGMEGEDLGELLRNCPAPIKLIGPPGNGTTEILGYQSDGINVLLYETQVHSGVFTAEIATTSRVTATVQSGIVQAATQGSFITLTYSDQVPAALRKRRVKVASVARLITDPTILSAGQNLTITLKDADVNSDQGLVETATVTIRQSTLSPHDSRNLVLTETSLDSDTFTGVLETSVDSADAGGAASVPMYAPAGSLLTLTFTDANPVPESVRSQVVPVSTRGVIHMQCPGGAWTSCSQYDITVTDADLNGVSDTIETHAGQVSIYNRRGEEEEQLSVIEKGVDNNAFTASIAVLVSAAQDCGGGGSRGDGRCL